MRYVILNKKINSSEIYSRKKYIEKVTNLFFIDNKKTYGIEFISIPSDSIDCIFIVGHNLDVEEYIKNCSIPEQNVVIVSCRIKINYKKLKDKDIYVSYRTDGVTNFYDGCDWNINFDISKEELKLINSTGTFMEKVKNIFRRIICKKK